MRTTIDCAGKAGAACWNWTWCWAPSALATGSLAKMEYSLVTTLSLTYSLQTRYQLQTRSGMDDLVSPLNLSDERLRLALYNAMRYLDGVTRLEQELGVTYAEAMLIINAGVAEMRTRSGSD